jgi:hypothetical protein
MKERPLQETSKQLGLSVLPRRRLFGVAAQGQSFRVLLNAVAQRWAYPCQWVPADLDRPLKPPGFRSRFRLKPRDEKLLDDPGQVLYYDPEFDRHLPFLYHKPKNTRILH